GPVAGPLESVRDHLGEVRVVVGVGPNGRRVDADDAEGPHVAVDDAADAAAGAQSAQERRDGEARLTREIGGEDRRLPLEGVPGLRVDAGRAADEALGGAEAGAYRHRLAPL